jgi:hypothetical protein
VQLSPVWPTRAVEVIADITEHEIDLIEIGKMIDDFGPVVVAALAGFVAEVIEKMALAPVSTAAKFCVYASSVPFECHFVKIAHAQGFIRSTPRRGRAASTPNHVG